MKIFVNIILSGILFFSACDTDRVFEENKEIEEYKWFVDAPQSFQVLIDDTATAYNFYINVRNAGYYRYRNVFMFINTHFPAGQIQRDTLECILASPDGEWLGDGLGDIYDNRILFKKGVRFPVGGEYKFELIQAMRVDPIDGIMDVGIRIEKANGK
jgi:gliding motility-associated lipoprotein GldH